MVCPRCITAVQDIFNTLYIEIVTIKLGEVVTDVEMSVIQKEQLEKALLENGFELLQDYKSKIITEIKTIIISEIHHKTTDFKINFSELLSSLLHQEYSSLSKLFSAVEGITIERFILKQKIEKVKELLIYNQLNLSEIAFQMNYSSTAHLSSQFKKETGMSPSVFKKMRNPNRQPLTDI